MSRRVWLWASAAVALLLAAGQAPALASGGAPDVRVEGNRFVDQHGRGLRLVGVDAGLGAEFACVEPVYNRYRRGGVWDGPVGAGTIAALRSWRVGAVLVSLNEDCWLGLNPVRRTSERVFPIRGRARAPAGRALARRYRREVAAYVRRLHAAGMAVILDLHWSAPGTTLASGQWPMPDRDHSPAFWRSVARSFRADRSVLFDLFNEPFGVGWRCLRDGCRVPNRCDGCRSGGGSYRAAGMQELVDAVRSTGARQPLLVPGREYASDLSRWLAYRPRDPRRALAASFHNYQGLSCDTPECWEGVIAPVAAKVPVVTGEFGQDDCGTDFEASYMQWADEHGVSYLAWWWMVGDEPPPKCTLDLVLDFGGAPRPPHGVAVHDHLAALSAAQGGGLVR